MEENHEEAGQHQKVMVQFQPERPEYPEQRQNSRLNYRN